MGIVTYRDNLTISISRGISVVIIICISWMKYCIELYFILFLISLSHTCDKMKNIFLYSSIFDLLFVFFGF